MPSSVWYSLCVRSGGKGRGHRRAMLHSPDTASRGDRAPTSRACARNAYPTCLRTWPCVCMCVCVDVEHPHMNGTDTWWYCGMVELARIQYACAYCEHQQMSVPVLVPVPVPVPVLIQALFPVAILVPVPAAVPALVLVPLPVPCKLGLIPHHARY
eukprot:2208-Pelagomonas_calceolata.AAC.2